MIEYQLSTQIGCVTIRANETGLIPSSYNLLDFLHSLCYDYKTGKAKNTVRMVDCVAKLERLGFYSEGLAQIVGNFFGKRKTQPTGVFKEFCHFLRNTHQTKEVGFCQFQIVDGDYMLHWAHKETTVIVDSEKTYLMGCFAGYSVFVKETHRRKGIAKTMYKMVQTWGIEKGLTLCPQKVLTNDSTMLYKSLGLLK